MGRSQGEQRQAVAERPGSQLSVAARKAAGGSCEQTGRQRPAYLYLCLRGGLFTPWGSTLPSPLLT